MLKQIGQLALGLLVLVCVDDGNASAQGGAGMLVRADAPALPKRFLRDSLAQRIVLKEGTLDVIAERSSSDPKITTGKYIVRLNGRQIAIGDDQSLSLGVPNLAALYRGEPTIVALASYTGGQGIPGYYMKLIVLDQDNSGRATARAFSLGATEQVSGDRLSLVRGPEGGEFVLAAADFTIAYSQGNLRLSTEAPASAPPPSAADERVYVANMKSDLRNLITAEEAYFADSVKYTDRLGRLGFQLTPGNLLRALRVTSDGFTAVVANTNTRTFCAIYVGSTAVPPAVKEGEPRCTQ